jgi:hypothetical protein
VELCFCHRNPGFISPVHLVPLAIMLPKYLEYPIFCGFCDLAKSALQTVFSDSHYLSFLHNDFQISMIRRCPHVTPTGIKHTAYFCRCGRKPLAVTPTCGPIFTRNYYNYKKTSFANFRNISHTAQYLPTSSFLSTNIKSKKHRTAIFPTVSYGCVTWSLRLRKENRLRVLEIWC